MFKFSTIVFLAFLLFSSTFSLKMKSRSRNFDVDSDLAINTDLNLGSLKTHKDRCDKDFDILRRVKNTIQVRNNTDTPYLNHQIQSLKDLLFSDEGKENWNNFVKTVFDEVDTDFNGRVSKAEMQKCFDVLSKYVHIPQNKLRDDLVEFQFAPERQPSKNTTHSNSTDFYTRNEEVELDFDRFSSLLTDICMLQLQQYRLEKIESLILSIFSDAINERTDYSVDLLTIHRLKTVLSLRNEENWEDFDAIVEYLFKITDVNEDGVIDHDELKEAYVFLSDYLNFPRELVNDDEVNNRMEMFAKFNNNYEQYVNGTLSAAPVQSINEKNNKINKVVNMNVLDKQGFIAVIFEVLGFVEKKLEEKVCSQDVLYSTYSDGEYAYAKKKNSKKLTIKNRNLSLSTMKLKIASEKNRSIMKVLNMQEEKPTLLELTISLNLLLNPHNPEQNTLDYIGSQRFEQCLNEINTNPKHFVSVLTEKDFVECFRGLDKIRELYQYYSSDEYLRNMFDWYNTDGNLDEQSFNYILRFTLDSALHEVFNAQCNEWRLGSVDVFSYSKLKSKKSCKSQCKTNKCNC